jgi:hypothetical protein
MKQSCVSAFARVARWFALAAVAMGLSAGALHAQATGKIEGKVRDQAGAPIANAQVLIVGSAFGALTNNQGYYFFNNVPVGPATVRAIFVGYKSAEAQGVRVLAGQTVTQDIQLEQVAFQVDAITIVATSTPLVPRDEVTTKQRLNGDYVEALRPTGSTTSWPCSRAWWPVRAVGSCRFAAAGPTRPTPTSTACR